MPSVRVFARLVRSRAVTIGGSRVKIPRWPATVILCMQISQELLKLDILEDRESVGIANTVDTDRDYTPGGVFFYALTV